MRANPSVNRPDGAEFLSPNHCHLYQKDPELINQFKLINEIAKEKLIIQ